MLTDEYLVGMVLHECAVIDVLIMIQWIEGFSCVPLAGIYRDAIACACCSWLQNLILP